MGIGRLALADGVFMIVEVNRLVREIPELEDAFLFPSCGDESNAIGATFQTHVEESAATPEPIGLICSGPGFTIEEELAAIKEESREGGFQFKEPNHNEDAIVDLLLKHKIVARIAGRMEFGTRTLGNRSILAEPADLVNVEIINRMIKMRDFWIPFARVVLAEAQGEHLKRPKPIMAPYMMLAFDAGIHRRHEMIATIHQADCTARPQVIESGWNNEYHEIISRFEKATGRGVLLKTSHNLHGCPLVLGPKEALSTFKNSHLKYVALGDFLIYKNQCWEKTADA
jgi:carbamoyltransferase